MTPRTLCLTCATIFSLMFAAAEAREPSLLANVDTNSPDRVFSLSRTLREISGLTSAGPSSVYAHNDEYAIVHEISLETGAIIRSFAFGKPTARGDFEGIARSGEFIYLISSDGKLHEARPAKHRERATYNIYDTGLGEKCEIEGIAADHSPGEFFFLCKRSTLDPARARLIVYRWALQNRLTPLSPWLDIALSDIDASIDVDSFRGSEITRDVVSGHLFILDSRGASLVELSPTGKIIAFRRLPPRIHPQAEGLAIMVNGDMVIGDEGAKRTGQLTIYTSAR